MPLGRAIGAVVMIPSAVIVTLSWIAHRITAFDVLSPPTSADTRWVRRRQADTTPDRASIGARQSDPRGGRRTVHRAVAGAVAVAAVAAGVGVVTTLTDDPEPVRSTGCSATAEPAVDGQDGWPDVGCEATEFAEQGRFDAVTVYTYADYVGDWVNVRDGVRRTWTPPRCDCPVVRVWWFGGSAAWGWHQGDLMSLPSQVARAAWRDGVALQIENHALPGWVLGQEVQEFASLTTTETPPDLAVFYDGANELARQLDRNAVGRGADESDTSYAEFEVGQVIANGPFDFSISPGELPDDAPERLPADEVAEHAMRRYARNVRLGIGVAAASGVTPRFFFQPTAATAPESTHDPAPESSRRLAEWRTMTTVARRQLPDTVTDLSDALDALDRPVFTDLVHTNEAAAGVLAEAIWAELRSSLPPGTGDRPGA